jgi:hypothetical protein
MSAVRKARKFYSIWVWNAETQHLMHKMWGNYSSCTGKSSANTCSSIGEMGENSRKLNLPKKHGAFLCLLLSQLLRISCIKSCDTHDSIIKNHFANSKVWSWNKGFGEGGWREDPNVGPLFGFLWWNKSTPNNCPRWKRPNNKMFLQLCIRW